MNQCSRPPVTAAAPAQVDAPLDDGTMALALAKALIPSGVQAIEDALQQEVIALAGVLGTSARVGASG